MGSRDGTVRRHQGQLGFRGNWVSDTFLFSHIGVSELNQWPNSWGPKILLGLQLGDGCNKKIKKITISNWTRLACRYKIYGDFVKR